MEKFLGPERKKRTRKSKRESASYNLEQKELFNNKEMEKRLWEAADELRANSKLKSGDFAIPVLGLIFLRFADHKFTIAEAELRNSSSDRREISKVDYHAKGAIYLAANARWSFIKNLPEGDNFGRAVNNAMKAIEEDNRDLLGVLPKLYTSLENATLIELIRLISSIEADIEGDVFGKIYEYFLGKFAASEGSKGGEYFTPTPIVKLIVEIIEPFKGRILDPACGSGGMFVQSARFVDEHKGNHHGDISIYGQERVTETVNLAKMNLAIHGVQGDIKEGNSYYQDLYDSVGRFDFVMANPPFNVNKIDKSRLEKDGRFTRFGLPKVDNGNYIWIHLFYSALNDHGRAGFVMANSAADARHTELEIRMQLIQDKAVDVIVAVGPNMFYTVTLPVTLWFLDREKRGTTCENTVLFIDAREIYRQIDRAHREFTPQQIEYIGNIVRLYRGESTENRHNSSELMAEHFFEGDYIDVPGLCKVATLTEIKEQGWSLNPGRYVGISQSNEAEINYVNSLVKLKEEYECLTKESLSYEQTMISNIEKLIEH